MFTIPAASPVTIPEVKPTVATVGSALTHVPPAGVDDSVVVLPAHSAMLPEIGAGAAMTVTVTAAKQLDVITYEIVVTPADSPVTMPDELTVPTAVLLLLHVPPGTATDRADVLPSQTVVLPVIGGTAVITVTTDVVLHPA